MKKKSKNLLPAQPRMMSKSGGFTHLLYPVLQRLAKDPISFKKKLKRPMSLRGIKSRTKHSKKENHHKPPERKRTQSKMNFEFIEEEDIFELLSKKVRKLSHIRPERVTKFIPGVGSYQPKYSAIYRGISGPTFKSHEHTKRKKKRLKSQIQKLKNFKKKEKTVITEKSDDKMSYQFLGVTELSPERMKKSMKSNTTRDQTGNHKRVKSYVDFKKMLGRGSTVKKERKSYLLDEDDTKKEKETKKGKHEYKKSDIVVNIDFESYPPRNTQEHVIKLAESHQTSYDPNYNFIKKNIPVVTLPKHDFEDDIRIRKMKNRKRGNEKFFGRKKNSKREVDGDLALDDDFLFPIVRKEKKKKNVSVPLFDKYLPRYSKTSYQIKSLIPKKNSKSKFLKKKTPNRYRRKYHDLDVNDIIKSNLKLIS